MTASALSETSALLGIECQRGLIDPLVADTPLAHAASQSGLVDHLNQASGHVRATGGVVVHCLVAHRPDWAGVGDHAPLLRMMRRHDLMVEGRDDVDLHPGIEVDPADITLPRATGLSVFYNTPLDDVLRSRGVETVVLAGVSTDLGIVGAALDAVARGYRVVIAADATAGQSATAHQVHLSETLPALARVTTVADLPEVLSR